MIDDTIEVRSDERFDKSKIAEFLQDKLDGAEDPQSLNVRQFGGGKANLTYLLNYPNHQYVLRRPPLGPVAKSAHDMGREFKVLSKLYQSFPKAPRAFLYHEDTDLLGSPFFVMERKKGIVIRNKVPEELKSQATLGRKICESLIDTLVELHKVDYKKLDLSDLGRPEGFIERQIDGWYRRWNNAKLAEVAKMDAIYNWLKANIPESNGQYSLIHNDYKLDNVMLDKSNPQNIIAVFDWDMCTLGDPMSDLGALLAYWTEPSDSPYIKGMATMPTQGMKFMTRDELVKRYELKANQKIDNINFYHCLGLFRVVVIIQQIYYRYVKGQTQDKRFAAFEPVIPIAIEAAYDLLGDK